MYSLHGLANLLCSLRGHETSAAFSYKKHGCYKMFAANLTPSWDAAFATHVAKDVFSCLPMAGKGKHFRMYLRVVIVHFLLHHIKTGLIIIYSTD